MGVTPVQMAPPTVEAELRSLRWTPAGARWVADSVPVWIVSGYGFSGAFFGEDPPAVGRIWLNVANAPLYTLVLHHEALHAWHYASVTPPRLDGDEMATDFQRLLVLPGETGDVARDLWASHQDDPVHLDHRLLARLGYDYSRVPQDYRLRWFGQGMPKYQYWLPQIGID